MLNRNELKLWFRNFFNIRNPYLYVSLFVSFLLTSIWFGYQSIQINNFHNLIPGIATFENIDIAKRLALFYKTLFLIASIFLLCILFFFYLNSKYKYLKRYLIPWSGLSLISVFFLFFKIIGCENPISFNFILVLFAALIIFQFIKVYFHVRLAGTTQVSFIWLCILSFSLSFFVRNVIFNFIDNQLFDFNIIFFILFNIILTSLIMLSIYSNLNFKKIFTFSLPFVFIPILSVISNELYMILNQRNIYFLTPSSYFLIFLLICLCIAFFIRKNRFNVNRTIKYYLFPVVLFSIIFFSQYKPIIIQSPDLFEMANPANAIMRLFNFHEIPIFQALSSHVLSDIGPKIIYVLLNGYSGSIDFFIYDFILNAIFIVILYFFLSKILKSSVFSFIITLFFPFVNFAILNHHSFIFITIMMLYNLYERYSFKKVLIIGLWSTFLIFWKIEIGISSFIATIFILSLYIKNNFRKEIIFDIVKVGSIIISFIIVIAFLISFILKIDLIRNFLQAKEYFGANQAHGLTDVTNSHDRIYYYHYYIFPIIALFLFIYMLINNKGLQNLKYKFLYISILFLLAYYLIQAQRGLVRHSLVEGSDLYMSSFFYLIVALFIYFQTCNKVYAKVLFVAVFTLVIHNFEYTECKGLTSSFEDMNSSFQKSLQIPDVNSKINRIIGTDEFANFQYNDFKKFMDDNFTPQSTFIDISLSPMLYFYTNRLVPSYFNQYIQNTVTDNLQRINLKHIEDYNIPVVILSTVPERWWENTDNVPNSIRYNRIVQYIYKNYRPFAVINNHYVWLKNGTYVNFPDSLKVDTSFVNESKSYNLLQYPFLLAKSDLYKDTTNSKSWVHTNNFVVNNKVFKSKFNNYFKIDIISSISEKNDAQLRYYAKHRELGLFTFTIVPSINANSYVIPISSQYNWVNNNIDSISISVIDNEKVIVQNVNLFLKNIVDEDK